MDKYHGNVRSRNFFSPTRLIVRTGLERTSQTSGSHFKQKGVIVVNNFPKHNDGFKNVDVNMKLYTNHLAECREYSEAGLLIRGSQSLKDIDDNIAVEERKTQLDAFLYNGDEQNDDNSNVTQSGQIFPEKLVVVQQAEPGTLICNICNKLFTAKGSFNRHKKNVHKNGDVTFSNTASPTSVSDEFFSNDDDNALLPEIATLPRKSTTDCAENPSESKKQSCVNGIKSIKYNKSLLKVGEKLKKSARKSIFAAKKNMKNTAGTLKDKMKQENSKCELDFRPQKQSFTSGNVEKRQSEANGFIKDKNLVKNQNSTVQKKTEAIQPFKCEHCAMGFRNQDSLNRHLPIHSMTRYHCHRCNDVFLNMRMLTKHLLRHKDDPGSNDRLLRCKVCSQGFHEEHILNAHLLSHQKISNSKSTSDTGNSVIEDDEDSYCSLCKLEFDTYSFFADHVINKHIKLGDMSMQCDKCKKIFTHENKVLSHLINHHHVSSREARALIRQKEATAVSIGINASMKESINGLQVETPLLEENNDILHAEASVTKQREFNDTLPLEEKYSLDFNDENVTDCIASQPRNENCFLEEQESKEILQALFINTDDDKARTLNEDVSENNTALKINTSTSNDTSIFPGSAISPGKTKESENSTDDQQDQGVFNFTKIFSKAEDNNSAKDDSSTNTRSVQNRVNNEIRPLECQGRSERVYSKSPKFMYKSHRRRPLVSGDVPLTSDNSSQNKEEVLRIDELAFRKAGENDRNRENSSSNHLPQVTQQFRVENLNLVNTEASLIAPSALAVKYFDNFLDHQHNNHMSCYSLNTDEGGVDSENVPLSDESFSYYDQASLNFENAVSGKCESLASINQLERTNSSMITLNNKIKMEPDELSDEICCSPSVLLEESGFKTIEDYTATKESSRKIDNTTTAKDTDLSSNEKLLSLIYVRRRAAVASEKKIHCSQMPRKTKKIMPEASSDNDKKEIEGRSCKRTLNNGLADPSRSDAKLNTNGSVTTTKISRLHETIAIGHKSKGTLSKFAMDKNVNLKASIKKNIQVCGYNVIKSKKKTETKDISKLDGYECSVCGKSFKRKANLERHVEKHKDLTKSARRSQKQDMTCRICKTSYKSANVLRQHLKVEHNKIAAKCAICGQLFSSVKSLMHHNKNFHKTGGAANKMDGFEDPLSTLTGIVDAVSLKRWSTTDVPYYPDYLEQRESKFPVEDDINSKIALWEGDITKLIADIIVNPTNESLNDKNPLSERIHKRAGALLKEECRNNLTSCRTGEAKVTKGYELPARYVAHTVGPRYNVKYKTAAESALFMCYRSVLSHSREHHLKSIGMSVIHTTRRGYPPEEGAHIALRAVRRFMEQNPGDFDVIVFVVEPIDESIYKRLLPLYFPRSKAEEQHAVSLLPNDVGNKDGEPYIEDRQIRIDEKPMRKDMDLLADKDTDGMDLINSYVGRHPFSTVAGDNDQSRRARLYGRSPEEIDVLEQQRKYAKWVKRSRTEDLSDIIKLRFLYQSGVDYLGRPVVVFVGRNLPAQGVDLNKVLSHFINVMDPIASRDYVIVYFNSLTTQDNSLSLSFLKDVYEMLDIKYRRNLKDLFVVHGNFWDRIVTWFFTLFSAASIKDKIHFITGVQYLYDYISPDQLEMPPFVLEYDLQENGPSYHSPKNFLRPGMS
eukprot:gene2643-3060_t